MTIEAIAPIISRVAIAHRVSPWPWCWAGPAKQEFRRALMLALTGQAKLPLSKCGVTALETLVYEKADLLGKGLCEAERSHKIYEAVKAIHPAF